MKMDACTAVEREVEKVIAKFTGINDHSEKTLWDLCSHIQALQKEMDDCKFLLV